MTAHSQKTEQKRLYNCVLSPLRWAKIYEKLENRATVTLKISDLVANAAVRVANEPENAQDNFILRVIEYPRIDGLTSRCAWIQVSA